MMAQKIVTRRRALRLKTKVSILIALITVSALIYWEQTALLYVFSTLAVCALLTLVAFADLESKDRELNQHLPPEPEDASE